MSKNKPVPAVTPAEEILNPAEVAAEQPAPEPESKPELARVLQAFEYNGQKYQPDDLALLDAADVTSLAASGYVDANQGAIAYCQSLGKTPV